MAVQPLSVLNMLEGMAQAKQSGFKAYARVLLEWYRNGTDPELRRQIEEALTAGKKKAKKEPEASNALEKKLAELRKRVKKS